MQKVKLAGGSEVEVQENLGDNMELLDALVEVDEGDVTAISKICSIMFDKDNKKKLYESLRGEDGRVPTTAVVGAIKEVLLSIGEQGKN